MAKGNFQNRVLLPALATVAMFVTCSTVAISNTVLRNGQTVSGEITVSSQVTRWSVPSGFLGFGSKDVSGPSQEFTLEAQKGDGIRIDIDSPGGGTLQPMLVLIGPNGNAVASEIAKPGKVVRSLYHYVAQPGTYRLVVLGGANSSGTATVGKYTVRVSGLSVPTANTAGANTAGRTTGSSADQVMKNLGLTPMSCGLPNVSQVLIGGDIRCTTQLNAPNQKFIYNTATQRLEATGTSRTTASNTSSSKPSSTQQTQSASSTQQTQSAPSPQQALESTLKLFAFEPGRYQKLVYGSGTSMVALDSDDNGGAFLAPTSSNPPEGQYLQFIPESAYRGKGYYRITNKYVKSKNLYLELDATDPKNPVVKMGQGQTGTIALAQLWRVIDIGNGEVWISNASFDSQNIKKVLENSDGKLELHDADPKTPEQRFKLERLSLRVAMQ
jgi:hypothetical protein